MGRKESLHYEFNRPCLIGIDYEEFHPESYRAVQIEMPDRNQVKRWGSGDPDADLAEALRWFAYEQPTQILGFRSSVLHFLQDSNRRVAVA